MYKRVRDSFLLENPQSPSELYGQRSLNCFHIVFQELGFERILSIKIRFNKARIIETNPIRGEPTNKSLISIEINIKKEITRTFVIPLNDTIFISFKVYK